MTVTKLPQFTPQATEFWAIIPVSIKSQLLANVFCYHCRDVVKIVDFKATVSRAAILCLMVC